MGLGSILALASAEFFVRIARLDANELPITFEPGSAVWGRFDAAKGWRNTEGDGENNRQGFRFPRDFTSTSTAERRVVLLGDSQVWGLGVTSDEHLGVLLENRFDDVEIYPFGVPGYGPVQEWLLLREILAKYQVDEVFAVAFVYNDLVDESVSLAYGGLQKPYLEKSPDGWKLRNVPVPRPILEDTIDSSISFFGRHPEMAFVVSYEILAETSALYRTLVQQSSRHPKLARLLERLGLVESKRATATATKHYSIRRIDGLGIPCWHLEACPEEHRVDGLLAVTAAYVLMDQLCQNLGIPFSVVLTPSYPELANARFDVVDALANSLEQVGIRVIDLRETFRSVGNWRNVVGEDRHWTAEGHRIVADAVQQAIAE